MALWDIMKPIISSSSYSVYAPQKASSPNWTPWADFFDKTVDGYFCPSDGIGYTVRPFKGSEPDVHKVMKSNYLPFTNYTTEANPNHEMVLDSPSYTSKGAFCPNRWRNMADFVDGLSNTMVFSEYLKGITPSSPRGYFYTIRAGCQFIFWGNATPNSSVPDQLYPTFCPAEENVPSLNLPCGGAGDNITTATACARSRHSGGVNTLRGDGSVFFITDSINITTYRALGTICGSESTTP